MKMVEFGSKDRDNFPNKEKELKSLIEEQKMEIDNLKNMLKIYVPYMKFSDQ